MREVVVAPGPLLLDRSLPVSARLLWLILANLAPPGSARGRQAADGSPRLLQGLSGLDRKTVVRGLALLESAGLISGTRGRGDSAGLRIGQAARPGDRSVGLSAGRPGRPGRWPAASIPTAILLDARLGAQARLMYGQLQLLSTFSGDGGHFSYREVAALTGLSLQTVKDAVRDLRELGWLRYSQANKFAPIQFTLANPPAERSMSQVVEVELRLTEAQYKGEVIMREILSLLVDSDEYEDNANPGFLVNPFTGERLQLDRYYPGKAGFEYNGPQHNGPTEKFPSQEAAWKQQGRDYIKLGICASRGLKLIVVQGRDLTLERMHRLVAGSGLPMRDLTGHKPLADFLRRVGRAYAEKAETN